MAMGSPFSSDLEHNKTVGPNIFLYELSEFLRIVGMRRDGRSSGGLLSGEKKNIMVRMRVEETER